MGKRVLISIILTLVIMNHFKEVCFSFTFFASNFNSPVKMKSSPSILMVERDVPQTRVGFEPIINHGTLIANLSDETIELDIESPIPKGLYVVKKFYPTFGQESLLAMPMYFPHKVDISNYKILEAPSIEKKNEETIFKWANTTITPKQAIIAQYENFFGNLDQFYTKNGLKVANLYIHTSYAASLRDGGKTVIFNLNYRLQNKGKNDLEDVLIDFILPDTVYPNGEGSGIKLFNVIRTTASPGVKFHRGMLGDGFGKAATGTIFTIGIPRLKEGEVNSVSLKVEGERTAEQGESFPLFTFQYRLKEGERIWPPTVLKSKKKLELTKFYYIQSNLVLPDSRLFKFEPTRINVVPIRGFH